jgi:N-acetylglutamate synthase-like GNAT family acetyltransferase
MINYLVTARHAYTMKSFLDSSMGKPLRHLITILPYENAILKNILTGPVIFSDIERLDERQRQEMSELYENLQITGSPGKLLNHPARSLRRFELLQKLYTAGINQFPAWRLKDLVCGKISYAPFRFPVFIRDENDHMGPRSCIINSHAAMWPRALKQVFISRRINDKVITGFLDTSDEQGLFRKYSAVRTGNSIIPRHIFFSRNWAVKDEELSAPALLEEELLYVKSNPHQQDLMKIFEMAGISYGRIDYALKEGKIQVWEINTNPTLVNDPGYSTPARAVVHGLFGARFTEALMALETDIVIRKMREEDMEEVLKLLAMWNMVPRRPTPEIPVTEHEDLIIDNTFVAEMQNRIIGASSYIFLSENRAETLSLVIDPQYQGSGIGHRLQLARMQEMYSRSIRYVHTEADRPETIEWYIKKFGYKKKGKLRKLHNFSLADVDYWTVLELDLDEYFSEYSAG